MSNVLHSVFSYVLHRISAKQGGHGVHSPFAYTLCEQVFYNKDAFYVFEDLSATRTALLQNQTQLTIQDFGAGSRVFSSNTRRVCDIAKKGISSQLQSELLFRLVQFLKPSMVIELGSSLGLNALYLAKAGAQVHSIEGSAELVAFAKNLAAEKNVSNIQFHQGHFDAVLPNLLQQQQTIDFAYIDGNHTQAATLAYFELFISKATATTVLVFDDIYWSKGMTQAWKIIQQHPKVRMSIDLYAMGLVFFKEEIKEKQNLQLYIAGLH